MAVLNGKTVGKAIGNTAQGRQITPIRPNIVESGVNEVETGLRAYHFVGIGGCGMSGLAEVLAQHGYCVTGSDMEHSDVIDRLRLGGIDVRVGHDAEALPRRCDFVVVSAAVKPTNPEWARAQANGVPVCKYAELLGQLSRQMSTIAVAGTHGKSTSSAWLAYVLRAAELAPSFVVGGDVAQLGGGSGAGTGEHLVVEACEYDRSFLNLRPEVAAILNIEADHLDYYRDLDDIVEAFGQFARCVRSGGLIVANQSDKNVGRALRPLNTTADTPDVQVETFGLGPSADWQPKALSYQRGMGRFELVYRGRSLGAVALSLAGEHNVLNALAVAALAHQAGAADEALCAALGGFTGVARRMSCKGTVNGVTVIDDYAHHPTEIQATLRAIAAYHQPRRLWCVFQPHQHSRTRFLLSDFALSFGTADVVLLPDIYFVRDSEQERRQISAAELAERINANGGRARYLGDFDAIAEHLCEQVVAGDVIVTMGAGDVWKLGDEVIRRLSRDCRI